jgi:hypothetical protein
LELENNKIREEMVKEKNNSIKRIESLEMDKE